MENQTKPSRRNLIVLLLLVPLVAVLVPEFYNFAQPSIGGMPFFYWWQLLWIAGVAVCVGVVYLVMRRTR